MRQPARLLRRPSLPAAFVLVLLLPALLLSACSLLGGGEGEEARLSLSLEIQGLGPEPAQALARSLWPSGTSSFFSPSGYQVSANGPSGQYLNQYFPSTGPVRLNGLLAGTWTISAWAYNSLGDTIARSDTASIVLGPGQAASLPLTLSPRWSEWSDGSFSMNLTWSPPFLAQSANNSDPTPSTITLTGLVGDEVNVVYDLGAWVSAGRNAVNGSRSLRPGLWRLDLSLNEYGDCDGNGVADQQAYWGLSEILYIAPYRDTNLSRTLSTSELRQPPAAVMPVFNGGVVVCDPADLHPSWLPFPGLEAGARVIYSYDGTMPACDALGNPLAGSYALDPGERVRMGRAEDSAFGGSDGVIRLSWLTWNPWGATTMMSADYYLEEFVYVDASATGMMRGTAADPFTQAWEGAARAGGLGRDQMTTVRLAKGGYDGEIHLNDGVRFSGSWTNASGSWSRDTAALTEPSTYTAANATVLTADGSWNGVVLAQYSYWMGVGIDYLAIEGSPTWSVPALSLGWSSATLELDHLRVTGRMASNDSIAIRVDYASSVIMKECFVEGRASSVTPSSGSATAFIAYGSDVLAQACIFLAGPAAPSWTANAIRAGSSQIRLEGGECLGASIGSAAGSSYGLYADSGSFIESVGTVFDSGFAQSTGVAVGIDLYSSWADLDGVTVTARDDCSESIAIRYADGINDYYCGSSLQTWQRLFLRGGSILQAGFPGASNPAQSATGLRLLSGRASVEDCDLIEAEAALQDSTGIWAGLAAYGYWVDLKVTDNESISGCYAGSGLGSGIRLEGALRASVTGNIGTAVLPGISGGSGGSSQAGIRISKPASIDVYPEGSCIVIENNAIQGNDQGGGTAVSSFGIRMDGGSATRPILISRNRIHAGRSDGGSLAGIWSSFDGSSGSSGGDIVIRNNAVSGGSYLDGVAGPRRAAVYHSRVSGHGQPFFLLSNTLIGPEGPAALASPVAWTAPLILANMSSPVIMDDILMAARYNRSALIRETSSALPLAIDHDAFFADAENDALFWDEGANAGSDDLTATGFFAVAKANIALSTASVFSSPLPASASAFFSHAFILASPQAVGDEGLLNGGIDLSAHSAENEAASPWWFSVDLSGAARSAPWSIGAREAP